MIKKLSVIIYSLFGLITIACLFGFFFQDTYSLIPINYYWDYLKSDSPRNDSKMIISLFYTILMGVFTAYFTVLSIILSRKKVSFFNFFRYTKSYDFLISSFVSVLFCTTILFFYRFSFLIEIYFSFSIVICFMEFLLSLVKISYLENKNRCSDLLFNYLVKVKKTKNINTIKNFFLEFGDICFPGESFTLLDMTNSKWKKRRECSKEIELLYISIYESIIETTNNRNDYVKYLDLLIKKAFEKSGNSESDFEIFVKIYELIFKVYQKVLLFNKDFPSQLLRIKEPAFYKLLLEKENPTEELLSFYKEILKECYRLISYSLYSCNFNTINNEIHEYCGMIQFFDLYPTLKELIIESEIHLIDIAIRIVNVVQVGKRNNQLLRIVIPLLDNIKTIHIFDGENELYDEILASTDVHEVYFTRNYFLALLLVYYGSFNSEEQLLDIIDKLSYDKSDSGFNERYKYSNILSDISKIKKEPQKAGTVINISKQNFISSIDRLINILTERVKNIDEKSMRDLREKYVEDELKKSISDEKNIIIKQFETVGLRKKKKSDNLFYILKSNFIFSKRVLCNDKSIIMLKMDYSNYLLPYLYSRFINLANKLIIYKLDEIKYLRENDRILISSNLMHHIYSKYNINFSDDSLIIKKKKIYFDWYSSKLNFIILERNFINNITLPDIPEETLSKSEKEEANDIQINIDYELQFYYSQNDEIKVYELII